MKLSINRVLDVSRQLATQAGQELAPYIQWTLQAFEQVLGGLQNGLTMRENMDCMEKELTVKHGEEINIDVGRRAVRHVIVGKVTAASAANAGVSTVAWWMNSKDELVLVLEIKGTPSVSVKALVTILF